jgi:hypothetical protein
MPWTSIALLVGLAWGAAACDGSSFSNATRPKKTHAASDHDAGASDDEASEDAHADPPPQEITGSFLTCAMVTPKRGLAPSDRALGCDVVEAGGHPVSLARVDVTARLVEGGDARALTPDRTGASGYQILLTVPASAIGGGRSEIHLAWDGAEVKVLATDLASVFGSGGGANAATATTGSPFELTFSARWTHLQEVCGQDSRCDPLGEHTYCEHGTLRAALLADPDFVPAPVPKSLELEHGAYPVDLTKACVRDFRETNTEHDARCMAVALEYQGMTALYVVEDVAVGSLDYNGFETLMQAHRCP